MPQQVSRSTRTGRGLIIPLAAILAVTALYADDGRYRTSPHGDPNFGVSRSADLPRGSCAQCHTSHDVISGNPFGLFEQNANQLCFSASAGGCHADRPTGGTSGYPAQESDRIPIGGSDPGYFEFSLGGTRIPGVVNRVRWPGRIIWENVQFSPHYADQDMPIRDFFGDGSCDNCHSVHGSAALHDMLDTTYTGISQSDIGYVPANYALCLNCHSNNGPVAMEDTSRTIEYYYDRSINPGRRSGHGVRSGGGYVPMGARLPCYDCHNPHGSEGYGGLGPNRYLLSDQRPGWYGLNDIKNDNAQVRRFCFGCHPPTDQTMPVDPVEGLTLNPLPPMVDAHRADHPQHCYDCHGRDYSSPTSNNVHNPAAGSGGGGTPGID